jgi:fructose-bisphosphate aldolase class I
VITIGDGQPTAACIETNAHALARYAALCQENGIVPIVEPEVLMDADNTAERCFDVTTWTLHEVFDQLHRQHVVLEHMLLKPNMVVSGKKCPTQAPVKQVAELTLRCFRQHVPAAVPGIVFLSGGQSDELATAHLDAMNRMGPHPWVLSYSYGRALQAPALKAWSGKAGNLAAGQKAYYHRAKMNGLAVQGKYEASMEKELAKV